MKTKDFKLKILKTAPILLVIACAVLLRLLPHPANVAPVAAMALFGGVYLDKKYAIVLPLLVMILSDVFLGFSQSTPFVYLCFALTGLIGVWLRSRKNILTVVSASLFSSVIFFLVTNFGYWLTYSLYPKTFEGQLMAYYFALPFFRNTAIGDLLYTGLFFGGYAVVSTYFRSLVSGNKSTS